MSGDIWRPNRWPGIIYTDLPGQYELRQFEGDVWKNSTEDYIAAWRAIHGFTSPTEPVQE